MTITHISPREAELERGVAELKAKAEMDYAMLAGDSALITGLKNEIAELKEKLAAYENREPVAWRMLNTAYRGTHF